MIRFSWMEDGTKLLATIRPIPDDVRPEWHRCRERRSPAPKCTPPGGVITGVGTHDMKAAFQTLDGAVTGRPVPGQGMISLKSRQA